VVFVWRGDFLGEVEHSVFEGEEDPRVDLESEVQVKWAAAPLLGVQVDLPCLAERVRLYEVPFIMDVKSVVDGVVLQVCYVSRDVDYCHSGISLIARRWAAALLEGQIGSRPVDEEDLLAICADVVDAVGDALEGVTDWAPKGDRPGQYAFDLVADRAALEVLDRTGLGVLSEESGLRRPDATLIAVIDPVDGSTNASRGIPWYACSICIVDEQGPLVSMVANLVSKVRYHAIRQRGAWRNGLPVTPSLCEEMGRGIVALSGYPRRHMGWSQYRVFGAASLDLCAVAEGMIDAYSVVGRSELGSWDYLGGMLICTEAGGAVGELDGLELVTTDHDARRSVAAAATSRLLAQVIDSALVARPPISVTPSVVPSEFDQASRD
jgi:myo-inositol-1(or 4)-monophosphatase